jgi:nucleotide-binding universal stress UspA family protein
VVVVKHILVAVDETEASRRAAAFVDGFFGGRDDVSIVAVNVARVPVDWMPPAPYGGIYAWPLTVGGERASIDEAVAREEAKARAVATANAPHDADVEVVFGEAVEAIERAAADEHADLIVIGSNDKGFLRRLLGGSVSEELARHGTRPLLIVP